MSASHDDDHDEMHCYRHPSRETALQCIACERPICIDCSTQGAVGLRCPQCARTSRASRGAVPVVKATQGIVAGAIVAPMLGTALAIAPVPFIGIILGYLVGMATGEVVRRASGGYRDPLLARAAAICAAGGVAWLPVAWLIVGAAGLEHVIWSLIAAGVAAYAAYPRAS